MKIRPGDLLLLGIYTLGAALAIYGWTDRWQGAAGLCVLGIAFAATMVRGRLQRLPPGQPPDFLTVFLTFQLVNESLTIVSLAAGPAYLKPADVANLVAPLYAFHSELALLTFLVLFTFGWRLGEQRTHPAPPVHLTQPRVLIPVYFLTIVLAVGLRHIGGTGALPTFMHFAALAVVGMLLLSDSAYGLHGKRALFSLVLLSPLFYLGMISGTKSGMIVVALPLLMAGLTRGMRKVMLLLAVLATFMVLVGIPLSQQMRAANWQSTGGGEHKIGLHEGLDRVWVDYRDGNALNVIASTFIQFCDRASSAQMGGVVMHIVHRDGFIGTTTINTLPGIFIPRVLWPDKPSFSPGAWFTWYLGKASSPQTATSATAMMLSAELYWMGGIFSLILLALGLGLLYAGVWRGLTRLAGFSLLGFAAMYALFGLAVRFQESSALYAFSQPITYLIYAAVLAFAERRARPVIKNMLPS